MNRAGLDFIFQASAQEYLTKKFDFDQYFKIDRLHRKCKITSGKKIAQSK
jgi:hypothetical protein